MNLFHIKFLSCWLMQESSLAAVTKRAGVRKWWIKQGIFPSLPGRLLWILWEPSSPLTDHSRSVLPGNHRKAAESCKTFFYAIIVSILQWPSEVEIIPNHWNFFCLAHQEAHSVWPSENPYIPSRDVSYVRGRNFSEFVVHREVSFLVTFAVFLKIETEKEARNQAFFHLFFKIFLVYCNKSYFFKEFQISLPSK